ncbi:MAG: hypothetical protein KAU90_08415, partial [Sulfurovaceae bacterium]|nr:hypothetical protein [Sulfurovaceae bacterium]
FFGKSVIMSEEYAIVGAIKTNNSMCYIFSPVTKTSIPENSMIAIDINASNASNYAISGGADQNLFEINTTTGIITFKKAPDFENPHDSDKDNIYKLLITVSDDMDTVSRNIEINVTNQILELDTISDINIKEDDSSFTIELNATDSDGDDITYTAISRDISIATVSISDNNLTITPIPNANGIVTIDVNATANNKSVVKSFDVNITAVNDKPVINTIFNDLTIKEDNGTSSYDINISDIDSSDLNLTIESNDTNILTVTPNWSGLLDANNWIKDFNLTTVKDANGIVRITITLNDGLLNEVKTFDVNVTAKDKTPNEFNFISLTNESLSTQFESNEVQISGIDNGINISIKDGDYRINRGTWTDLNGTINNDDNVTVRLISDENYSTTSTATLIVGYTTKAFSVTTMSKPTPTPSPTVTPTPTSSPTVIPTPTPSPTVISTPTPSPTVISTPTPSPTVIPTPTPSPTVIPTPTPSPTVIPTPT